MYFKSELWPLYLTNVTLPHSTWLYFPPSQSQQISRGYKFPGSIDFWVFIRSRTTLYTSFSLISLTCFPHWTPSPSLALFTSQESFLDLFLIIFKLFLLLSLLWYFSLIFLLILRVTFLTKHHHFPFQCLHAGRFFYLSLMSFSSCFRFL